MQQRMVVMRRWLDRPQWQFGVVGAVVLVLAIITGGAALLAGSGGGDTTHLPLTVPTLAPSKDGTILTISRAGTEARFTVGEVLLGRPNTVVGRTNMVAGQILVDPQNPARSKVGEIKVDLSTLTTDNGLRNRTLWSEILQTTQPANQFATFLPARISGLPSSVSIGQPVAFQLTGALTIHQITRTETFQVQVTLTSPTVLKGTAETTVRYEDFHLTVPRPPMVASVNDQVLLALSFTARAP